MTRYGSADVGFLLADGLNILGDTTDLEDEDEAMLEDTTVLGLANEEQSYIGVKRYTLNQNGFYNDATGRSNEALVGIGGTPLVSFAPEGNALGKRMRNGQLVQATYKRQIQRGALHKAAATYMSEGQHDVAVILHPLGAETADGDTEATSYDGTAQSANGGVAFLQVTALDLGGYDDVTITVIDDADNAGSFGSLVAFANVSAIGSQRVTVAGTVERYLGVSWVFNGSGSDPSISFVVGFKRN